MEYTDEQKAAFKAEFKKRRQRQLYAGVPALLLMIAMLVFGHGDPGPGFGFPLRLLIPVFILSVAGTLVFSYYDFRCPACNKYLDMYDRLFVPKVCPRCRVEVR